LTETVLNANALVLLILVFLPVAAGFLLLFVGSRNKSLGKALALIISIIAFALAVEVFAAVALGHSYSWSFLKLQIYNQRLDLLLSAKPLGAFILLFACGFGLLITLYSLRTTGSQAGRANQYYGAILLTIGGSAGILLSNHLLFLLIFWEVVTASLYLLITTGGRNCNFAATKSFAMIGASDAAFLLGLLMVWAISGTFVISDISVPADSAVSIIAFLLLMTAAITKAGAMPLHTWLPTSG
jgi:formate hydrogenlyase subunit 3/multisubunit Na+/H+ antiporter MnhD subunit